MENTNSKTGRSGWNNGNFISSKVTGGKITSKAGEIPYFHADYTTTVEMSKAMYNTSSVQSGLITGTMWDVALNYISSGSESGSFTKSDTTYHYGIRTSGWSEGAKKKNIYDMAGNLWEWTQECVSSADGGYYMLRGGSFYNDYASYPACFRGYQDAPLAYTHSGFRVTLYIK